MPAYRDVACCACRFSFGSVLIAEGKRSVRASSRESAHGVRDTVNELHKHVCPRCDATHVDDQCKYFTRVLLCTACVEAERELMGRGVNVQHLFNGREGNVDRWGKWK